MAGSTKSAVTKKDVAKVVGAAAGAYTVFMVIKIALFIANVVLYVKTFEWIRQLDHNRAQCACAQNWRKDYILWFPPLSLLTMLVIVFLPPALSSVLGIVMLTGWVMFVLSALGYVELLRDKKCACATDGTGDEILHIFAYMPVIGWSISIVFVLILLLIMGKFLKKK